VHGDPPLEGVLENLERVVVLPRERLVRPPFFEGVNVLLGKSVDFFLKFLKRGKRNLTWEMEVLTYLASKRERPLVFRISR